MIWFQNYISTYIERDLRNLAQIRDLDSFQRIYKLLAFQTGNILSMSSLAEDAGVSIQTIKRYTSILETSYQCKLLPAYFINQKKQIIKSPKIFYCDTGLVNYFLQNDSIDKMLNCGQWGSILETYVFSELCKEIKDIIPRPAIYYWRTNNGAEVDFIIEYKNKLIPIEVKSSIQIKPYAIRGIKSFIDSQQKSKIPFGIILYRGDNIIYLEKNIIAIPLGYLF